MKKRIFWILIALALAALPACSAPFLDMNIAAEAPVAPAMQTQPAVEAPFVEEPVETPVPDMPATAPEPAGNVYTDDMLGFEITLPDGWAVRDGAFYDDRGSVEVYTDAYAPHEAVVSIAYILGESVDAFAATAEDFVAEQAAINGAEGQLAYDTEDVIGNYPCYAMSYLLVFPDGDATTTVLYAVDGSDGGCYFLYYALGVEMSEDADYVVEAEEIIRSLNITGASLDPSMFEDQPQQTGEIEEQVFEPDDFLFLAGAYTPEDVVETYGTTDDIEEDDYTVMLNYNNMSFAFFKDPNTNYTEAYLNGVTLLDASVPVGVGGVVPGMSSADAQAIIEGNGYEQNMDIWEGAATLYYEFYDEWGELCFVAIEIQDGVVAQVTAMWGPDAFDARDDLVS